MEFIKTDKPLWDRMLSSPPSPSWILPHIQWSIHWPIGNCLSPSSHGKMSLFTVIWKAISPHHHSRTNGQSKWPFSFTTSNPLYHHCFIPSSTAKLINLIISCQDDSMVRTISSSTVLNMMIIIDHQWLNNIPSPASMTKAIPACCYQERLNYLIHRYSKKYNWVHLCNAYSRHTSYC